MLEALNRPWVSGNSDRLLDWIFVIEGRIFDYAGMTRTEVWRQVLARPGYAPLRRNLAAHTGWTQKSLPERIARLHYGLAMHPNCCLFPDTLLGVMLQEGTLPPRELQLLHGMCQFYGIPHALASREGLIVMPDPDQSLAAAFTEKRQKKAQADASRQRLLTAGEAGEGPESTPDVTILPTM